MAVFLYRIYDTKKEKYVDGEYQNKEVRKLLGIRGEISTRARDRVLINGRYIIELIGDKSSKEDNFAKEWDKARMKLLHSSGKKRVENNEEKQERD